MSEKAIKQKLPRSTILKCAAAIEIMRDDWSKDPPSWKTVVIYIKNVLSVELTEWNVRSLMSDLDLKLRPYVNRISSGTGKGSHRLRRVTGILLAVAKSVSEIAKGLGVTSSVELMAKAEVELTAMMKELREGPPEPAPTPSPLPPPARTIAIANGQSASH